MAKQKSIKFRIGEIIRIASPLGLPPAGIYRVDGSHSNLLMLSAGDIRTGVDPRMVTVLERELPEPTSWLSVEVDLLTQQVIHCDCAACRKLLMAKKMELSSQQGTTQQSAASNVDQSH